MLGIVGGFATSRLRRGSDDMARRSKSAVSYDVGLI